MSKGNTYLYVDGYNVINYWPDLIALMNTVGLDAAREELIGILGEYQELSGEIVTLVFDAHMVKGGAGKKEIRNDIRIVYTEEHETADSYIERQTALAGRHDRIKVATSDGMIQQTVLSGGGTRMSSKELLNDYNRLKDNMRRTSARKKLKNDEQIGSIDEAIIEKLDELQNKMGKK